MKKTIWIVAGIVLLLGAGIFISREKAQNTQKNGVQNGVDLLATKNTKTHEKEGSTANVDAVSSPRLTSERDEGVASREENLSDPVKALLGLDGEERNYPKLIAEVHKLGDNLSDADVAALRELLTWPNDRFPEKMRAIEINAVKNDVLDKLLRQEELSEGLGVQIAEMAGSADNDSVWRDYCVQFMQPYYERCSAESGSQTTEDGELMTDDGRQNAEASAIREAMFDALDERSETIAGTALIGLELLSRDHEEFDREQIVGKAVEVASDWDASPSCRLTALRMASLTSEEQGAGGREMTADAARTLAQTGDTVLLRSAAIVTLGETGSEEDRELLNSFSLSDNKQIAAAANPSFAVRGQNRLFSSISAQRSSLHFFLSSSSRGGG